MTRVHKEESLAHDWELEDLKAKLSTAKQNQHQLPVLYSSSLAEKVTTDVKKT